MSGETHNETAEYRYQHPRRGLIWLGQSSRVVDSDPQGRPIRLVGVLRDITDQKQAEEEMKKSYAEIARLKDKLEAENRYLRDEALSSLELKEIIGMSDVIKYVHYRISQVASLDTTVLIVGETGTGKGLVARALHAASLLKDRPMIPVNCAVLPANPIKQLFEGKGYLIS
jgi:transcriptional regulator with GAF, ATPase, and Fis domain